MRFVSRPELLKAVPMKSAIESLRDGFRNYHLLGVDSPARTFIRRPARNMTLGAMPVYCEGYEKYLVKLTAFIGENWTKGSVSLSGLVCVFDTATGDVEAVIEGASFTALRTGATSGLVTDLMAPPEASTVAIVGSGAQAYTQLEAMCCVRPIRKVRVYSRVRENVLRFIDSVQHFLDEQCDIKPSSSVAEAVHGADIVCTCTTSATPVFSASDVKQGVHVNAVGKHTTETREIPMDLMMEATLIVENRAAAVLEAGAYNERGVEIAEILAGAASRNARGSAFVSVGTAFQDLCVAQGLSAALKSSDVGQALNPFD